MKSTMASSLAVVAFAFTSCDCYKKMGKKIDQVEYSCTPEVLSLNNGEVTANITVKFPPKYFNEGAVLKITPVLVFEHTRLRIRSCGRPTRPRCIVSR